MLSIGYMNIFIRAEKNAKGVEGKKKRNQPRVKGIQMEKSDGGPMIA